MNLHRKISVRFSKRHCSCAEAVRLTVMDVLFADAAVANKNHAIR